SKEKDTRNCVAELERCIKELGFVGAYLNPDPAGDKQTPGVHEEYWFLLYEKAVQLDAPLMIHPSITYDRRLEVIPANYQMNNYLEEFVAMQLYSHSKVFETFPKLKIVICHCGGGLNRFIPTDHHVGQKDLRNNLYYDCCAYDVNYLTAAIKQRGIDQMLFGTESPGSGGAVRPETGKPSDDLVPVVDSLEFLSAEENLKFLKKTPWKVFPKVKFYLPNVGPVSKPAPTSILSYSFFCSRPIVTSLISLKIGSMSAYLGSETSKYFFPGTGR